MKGHKILAGVSLALVVAATGAPARAWDTYVTNKHDWRSIYQNKFGGTGSYHKGPSAKGNEHAEVMDDMLFSISQQLGDKFGVDAQSTCTAKGNCDATPLIVDLNASFMRPELFGVDTWQDDTNTVLEERRLPPLAMWSGLADFNYTVYDWINKGTRCPVLPLDADGYEYCHVYEAWLGAGLNSTHWGDLAVKIYDRYHRIALKQAQRAADMRKRFRGGGGLPDASSWYADYVREAELLALIYETAGDHFMQDRWSMGHMSSRWGPGSYEEMPKQIGAKRPLLQDATKFGVLAGIVHGSLAVFGNPDPMCAPLVDYNLIGHDDAQVMSWRYTKKNQPYPDPDQSRQNGVGDYYYADVMDDTFDGSVLSPDPNISISKIKPPKRLYLLTQHKALRYCVGEGVREVISRFDKQNGTYGEYGLTLPAPDNAKVFSGATATGRNPADDPICTDDWATNDSMWEGARTIAGATRALGEGLVNDIVVVTKTTVKGALQGVLPDKVKAAFGVADPPPYTPSAFRATIPYIHVLWQIYKKKYLDERKYTERNIITPDIKHLVRYGADSAKAGIDFSVLGIEFSPNQHYKLPGYYEPEDLDTLHWFDEKTAKGKAPSGGKDGSAVDGFFNKARTESWCKMLYGDEKTDQTKAVTLKLLRQRVLEKSIAAAATSDAKQKQALQQEATRAKAMCSYLAMRVYKGTPPSYPAGSPRYERVGEYLPFDSTTKFGSNYEPVCRYFDTAGAATNIETKDDSDDDKPYYIKPGYVGTPGEQGGLGYGPKTLEHWCDQIPVLNLLNDPAHPDIVGEIASNDGARWLKLTGENLGIKTGSGAVGDIQALDANGTWQSLDVWDGQLKTETGGWSYTNQEVWGRITGSKQGFPSNATAGMLPHQIKALAPREYEVRLIRPYDPKASAIYRADSQQTVGKYLFRVYTSYEEVTGIALSASQTVASYHATYPAWLRDPTKTEILINGFYKVSGGVYTPLNIPFEYKEGGVVTFDSNNNEIFTPDKDKVSVVIRAPGGFSPATFDGTVAYVFAFH